MFLSEEQLPTDFVGGKITIYSRNNRDLAPKCVMCAVKGYYCKFSCKCYAFVQNIMLQPLSLIPQPLSGLYDV
ncbi:hypothetical protein AV650_12890 [Serratia fonticola]|nr:hypothetical protein AV650_12890 [Serratia fonticola]ERK14629.1 hypothetical protein L581_1782 [Serratia fonticola AU-AP2C]